MASVTLLTVCPLSTELLPSRSMNQNSNFRALRTSETLFFDHEDILLLDFKTRIVNINI